MSKEVVKGIIFSNRDIAEEFYEFEAASRILKAINLLIENSEEAQHKLVNGPFKNISNLQMAKEFCTVKVSTARQTGHSTAIAQFILNRTKENWIVIAPKLEMVEHVFDMIAKNSIITNEGKRGCVISERGKYKIKFYDGGSVIGLSNYDIDTRLCGVQTNGILIDCSTFISDKIMDEIYCNGMTCMVKNELKYFICIE